MRILVRVMNMEKEKVMEEELWMAPRSSEGKA